MSQRLLQIKRIESLNSNDLADVLEFNGYGQCVTPIRSKDINGEQFLKLTEVQISLWRLPVIQSRRLWSFIQQVKSDPKQLLIELTQNSKSESNTVKKSNTKVNSFLQKEDNLPLNFSHSIKNIKSSSLTKQESSMLKNKLEGMFKQESHDNLNKSFVHQQMHPKLPPKPSRLQKVDDSLQHDELEETVEEYLEPIQRNVDSESNIQNDSSFLSKYRRNSEQFNNKIEINAEDTIRSFKNRPLPPPPPIKVLNQSVSSVDNYIDSDEEISDYTPIPAYIHADEIVDETVPLSKRPLPPLPVQNKEEIPEYTSVIDEDDNLSNHVMNKPPVFRRPPPPEPYFRSDSNVKKSASISPMPITKSFNIQEQLTSALQQKLKPSTILPKPPIDLPALPMPFLSSEESKIEKIQNLREPERYMQETSDEDESVDEDILENVPCYRETDRKGAKMLLTGLEDGAFIVRPSRQSKYVCTLSIMHSKKMFNVGIEQGEDNMLVFGSVAEDIKHPTFYTVKDLIAYYMMYPLHLYGDYIKLKNVLPLNKR